jgi:hypothetical protein
VPLKQRFFLQSEDLAGAQARLKASAAAIQDSEKYIAKKAWPYVQNQLRLEAQYLNFDIDTIASSKSKEEKKAIKALQKDLNAELDTVSTARSSCRFLLRRQCKNPNAVSQGPFLCTLGYRVPSDCLLQFLGQCPLANACTRNRPREVFLYRLDSNFPILCSYLASTRWISLGLLNSVKQRPGIRWAEH